MEALPLSWLAPQQSSAAVRTLSDVARLSSAFYTLVAFALVVVATWAVVRGVEKAPSVVGPIAAAAAAIIVAVAQRNFEKRRELETAHRAQMAPIYEELVDTLKDLENRTEDENLRFFRQLHTKLLVWGPTPVIREWLIWQRLMAELESDDDPTNPTTLLAYERVLLTIRADLGHDNSGLAPGDLLRIYVNDIDIMIPLWNARQSGLTLDAAASSNGPGD